VDQEQMWPVDDSAWSSQCSQFSDTAV